MKAFQTLFFILGVIALLALTSWLFPAEGVTVMGKTLYFPSLEDVLVSDETRESALLHLEEMERQRNIRLFQDSLNRKFQDSLNFYNHFFENNPGRFHIPNNNYEYFAELFKELEEAKSKGRTVHILHYGDSQIEGDRITGYIRQRMQERFGGNGAGLLPAVQIIPSTCVGQTYSGGIERYIVSGAHSKTCGHRRYGALGQMGQLYSGGSISVSSRNWKNTFENVKEFSRVRLYVGNTENFSTTISAGGSTHQPTHTRSNSFVKIYDWELNSPVKKVTVNMSGKAEIYGVSLDGEGGVAVDNIPFRGSSGTFFTSIDSTSLVSMYKDLDVGLILLEFGGNTMPVVKSDKTVDYYKTRISTQLAYLKRVYPQARIVFIGPSDMATTVGGKLQTYPYMEKFIQGLKEAAHENGVVFWSMFDAMGGRDSMISWVKNSPSLAATDYIHFNNRGVEKIAEIFFESLMIYYDYYQFKQNHDAEKAKGTQYLLP